MTATKEGKKWTGDLNRYFTEEAIQIAVVK